MCLLALACLAPPASWARTVMSGQSRALALGGVNVGLGGSPERANQDVTWAHALHAKVLRANLSWAAVEPDGPQVDTPALGFIDRLGAEAAASGMRVILTVFGTPCWDSSAPAALLAKCKPGKEGGANAWPPRDVRAYAAFTAFLAQRYGSQLAAIEIWNEPDQANQDYLAGPDKAAHYAQILRAAYPAIKQVNPTLPVLAGSLVGSNGAFLRELYAAGIKGYYDGLAVHFYNLVLGSLRAIHQTQLANGDSAPLWLDEFGWSSCYPRQKIQQEQACVTPRIQAQNITNTFRALAHTPYIAAVVLYGLHSSSQEDFGVLSPSGARKPAFGALARVLSSPLGAPSPVTLRLTSSGDRVLASGAGPVGDYMQLEAFRGGVLRYRTLFILSRANRYSIRLPAALGTQGLRVRVFQYWEGIGRAAHAGI